MIARDNMPSRHRLARATSLTAATESTDTWEGPASLSNNGLFLMPIWGFKNKSKTTPADSAPFWRNLVRVWRRCCSFAWSTLHLLGEIAFVSVAFAARLCGRLGACFAKARSCLAPMLPVYVVDLVPFFGKISFASGACAARFCGRFGAVLSKSRSCLAPLLPVYVVDLRSPLDLLGEISFVSGAYSVRSRGRLGGRPATKHTIVLK
jgi:hypothetical protein